MSTDHYGSINEETPLVVSDVEEADVAVADDEVEEDRIQVGVYHNATTNGNPHKKTYGRLFLVVALVAVVALLGSPVSPLQAGLGAVDGGAAGAPAPAPFNWTAYGQSIKAYWADKKATWNASKTEMTGTNMTAAEYKAEKSMFWNSSANGFADVLNVTSSAEFQAKMAADAAKKAAKKEAKAEAKAEKAEAKEEKAEEKEEEKAAKAAAKEEAKAEKEAAKEEKKEKKEKSAAP